MSRNGIDYIKIGIVLGYPDCCIKAFGIRRNSGINTFKPLKLNGTGYIPCDECNKKSKQELKDAINRNRTYPEPFPKGQLSQVVDWIVEQQLKEQI